MSYLASHQQDWRSNSAYALVFASLAGAATTVGSVGGVFTWLERDFFADPGVTWGYIIGMILAGLVKVFAVVVPAATVCALGLAMLGVPVSRRLGDRLIARWTVLIGLAWGGIAGGLFWMVVSTLVSGWDFQWSGLFFVGATFGAPTGFWWWFFYRRVLIHRVSVQN